MTKLITYLLAALISVSAFASVSPSPTVTVSASPFTASLDAQYASRFIDKGVASGPILLTNVGVNYQSFGLVLKTFAPTEVSLHHFKIGFSRVDVSGTYTFNSTLADLTGGYTIKHYNTPGTLGQGQHSEFFAKATTKGLPLSLIVRYDVATRNLNTEAATKVSIKAGPVNLIPSAYAGYGDISDQLPHSLKAIKRDNRYYGGGLGVSRKVLGGDLSIGEYVNRSDHDFQNTTFLTTVAYSAKF